MDGIHYPASFRRKRQDDYGSDGAAPYRRKKCESTQELCMSSGRTVEEAWKVQRGRTTRTFLRSLLERNAFEGGRWPIETDARIFLGKNQFKKKNPINSAIPFWRVAGSEDLVRKRCVTVIEDELCPTSHLPFPVIKGNLWRGRLSLPIPATLPNSTRCLYLVSVCLRIRRIWPKSNLST